MVSQCPRCSLQISGILCSDDSGYFIHCISCGYIVRDWGYRRSSFKALFAKYNQARQERHEEINYQAVRVYEDNPALRQIQHFLETCCKKNPEGTPICKECRSHYDALAKKSTTERITSQDIWESISMVAALGSKEKLLE
jgi:Zn ribbon nucleic-acid-binding protein